MNLSTILIGLVLILLFLVPVIFLVRASSGSKRKFIKDLIDLAKSKNCSISEHDHWNNRIIGMDKDHRNLFYINKTTNNELTAVIDLTQVKHCEVVKKSRNTGKKANNLPVIQKLELVFSYIDNNKPDTSLDFFNSDFDSSFPEDEFKLAEKWAGIVNEATAGLLPGPGK